MKIHRLAALAFIDETNKIAAAIHIPINQITVEQASSLISDFVEKEAATRAVKEWRKADAAGDVGTADTIAKGYGEAGLKPRYLKDVSLGGAEAGVDQMMGDVRHSTGQFQAPDVQSPRRELYGRLDQMKANKETLGLEGRAPTQSVKSSPEGRAALLRGTQPTPSAGAAPNDSGYIARKMYKPDSYISQAEFTPQHVQQKMDMTQAARALSPEAKSMVPDMYGMKTQGTGPTQRTMSYHEFVPGMKDLRGQNISSNPDRPIYSNMAQASRNLSDIKGRVLDPLAQKGMTMGDVTGERGTNWGNIARAQDGSAKVVDFLPQMKGQQAPAMQSFMKYAPGTTLRHSEEGGGSLGDLRKEMYKPTMQSRPASQQQLQSSMQAHGVASQPTPAPVSGVAKTMPAPSLAHAATSLPPQRPMNGAPTTPAIPKAAPLPAMQPARTAPATPAARPAAPALQPARTGAATPGALRPPMPHLPTKPAMGVMHR